MVKGGKEAAREGSALRIKGGGLGKEAAGEERECW